MSTQDNAPGSGGHHEEHRCCGGKGGHEHGGHGHGHGGCGGHGHGEHGHGHGGCGGHGHGEGGHGHCGRHGHAPAVEAAPAPAAQPKEIPGAPLPEGVTFCNFDDFAKIRLTVAEIIQAEPHPKADKLIKLQIRLGDREKQICAGIRAYYQPEELVGKRIVVVDNLEPRKLRGEMSNGMLLAAHGPDDSISLVTLDKPDFPSGGQVS